MTDRMDVIHGTKNKSGSVFWTKVGVAFPTKKRDGWLVHLNYVPTQLDEYTGGVVLLMKEPMERQPDKDSRPTSRNRFPVADIEDDDIPF